MGMKAKTQNGVSRVLGRKLSDVSIKTIAALHAGIVHTDDIAKKVGTSTNATAQTLMRLRQKGLVVRANPTSYGRGVKAVHKLTAKGLEVGLA